MATRQAAGHKQRGYLGRVFVALGSWQFCWPTSLSSLSRLNGSLKDSAMGSSASSLLSVSPSYCGASHRVSSDRLLLTHLSYLGIILCHGRHNRGVCPAKIAHRRTWEQSNGAHPHPVNGRLIMDRRDKRSAVD